MWFFVLYFLCVCLGDEYVRWLIEYYEDDCWGLEDFGRDFFDFEEEEW